MSELGPLLPLVLPATAGLVALVIAGFRPDDRALSPLVAAAGIAAGLVALRVGGPATTPILSGMVAVDPFAAYVALLVLALTLGAACVGVAGFRAARVAHGEYWALLLFAVSGMVLVASAHSLVTLFLGVETMSLSVYALVGSDRATTRSPEAALKYFLLGSVSSAVLLFGIAFVYGATGSMSLAEVNAALRAGLAEGHRAEMMVGTVLLLAGLAFKTAATPFHMWAPDAYTGAPTAVTAFMSSAVKAASFAALLRLFAATLLPTAGFWSDLLAVAAGLTVVVGNLGAVVQSELKRLFAYSSIAHAGYLLIGVRAASIDPTSATPAVLFYLFAYTVTSLGIFAAIAAAERWQGRELSLDDLAGMSRRHPVVAAVTTVFLLALAGVPPTGGFTAKLFVFGAAVKVGDLLLAILGVVASAVSLYYYLRVAVYLYMREPEEVSARSPHAEPFARMPSIYAVLGIAAAIVIATGILPDTFLRGAREAAVSAKVTRAAGL